MNRRFVEERDCLSDAIVTCYKQGLNKIPAHLQPPFTKKPKTPLPHGQRFKRKAA
jgi:hypothetical protein